MADPGLTTARISRLFSAEARVKALLDVEAALADSQAKLGLIPVQSAAAIASVCRALEVDPGEVLAQGWERGTPLLPLLDLVRSSLPDETHAHLHWETTTQDIVDTALVWRCSQAIGGLWDQLVETGNLCAGLADEHRHTWMTGRTFLQAGQPTTFGARAAFWLMALTARLRSLALGREGLTVQLGGPVGLGAGMGGRAEEVAALLGEHLGLGVSEITGQTDREPLVALGGTVAGVARTAEKIAGDLMVLAQTEVAEIHMRSGGSTSMPHKTNPVDAMRALAAVRVAVSAAAGLLVAPPPRLERDAGIWQVEWHLISEVFAATSASVEAVHAGLSSLQVDPERMRANLEMALGEEQPDEAGIDRLVDTAIAAFDKSRSAG